MKRMVLFAVALFMPTLALCGDQPKLTVEVLKAETVHWTTYWNTPASSGTTTTNCSGNDDGSNTNVNCTSTTSGQHAASSTPIYHTQVNLLVKMPDGNTLSMQCHTPPIWATCFQPNLGNYSAKINGHNVHLLIEVTDGRPKYNKDGTIKKPAKTKIEEVKFSF